MTLFSDAQTQRHTPPPKTTPLIFCESTCARPTYRRWTCSSLHVWGQRREGSYRMETRWHCWGRGKGKNIKGQKDFDETWWSKHTPHKRVTPTRTHTDTHMHIERLTWQLPPRRRSLQRQQGWHQSLPFLRWWRQEGPMEQRRRRGRSPAERCAAGPVLGKRKGRPGGRLCASVLPPRLRCGPGPVRASNEEKGK